MLGKTKWQQQQQQQRPYVTASAGHRINESKDKNQKIYCIVRRVYITTLYIGIE